MLFKYSCLHFLLIIPPPQPSTLPTINPTLLWLCPWVLYTCSLTTLPFLSSIISLPLPSGHWQFVPYFSVSVNILLAGLLCWLASTYRWHHMVFDSYILFNFSWGVFLLLFVIYLLLFIIFFLLVLLFSHTVGSLFILLMFSLAMQKFFYFGEFQFVYSFLYVPCSRGHINENSAAWNIWDCPVYVLL